MEGATIRIEDIEEIVPPGKVTMSGPAALSSDDILEVIPPEASKPIEAPMELSPDQQKEQRIRQAYQLKFEEELNPSKIALGIGRVYKVAKETAGAGLQAGSALLQKALEVQQYITQKDPEAYAKIGVRPSAEITPTPGFEPEDIQKAIQFVYSQGEEWYEEAKNRDPNELDDFISESVGAAVPGIAAWMGNIPWAMLEGAVEAQKEGDNEAWGALTEGVKRYALGRIFHFLGKKPKAIKVSGMGTTFGAQAKLEGAEPVEAAKAAIEGFAIGMLPSKKKGKEKVEVRPEEIKEVIPPKEGLKPEEVKFVKQREAAEKEAEEFKFKAETLPEPEGKPFTKEEVIERVIPEEAKPLYKPTEAESALQSQRGEIKIEAPGREATESLYQNLVNRFAAIENTVKKAKELGATIQPGRDAGKRAREYLGIGGKVKSILEDKTFRITKEGKIETTGEGLYPILRDYERVSVEKNANRREQDLNDYLIAKRTVEDLQRPRSEWDETLIVSPEQVEVAKIRLKELETKYGGLEKFETIGQRLYDFQSRMLHTLVESGVMSEGTYQGILEKNKHYIPFQRVLDTVEPGVGGPQAKYIFSGARSPIKKIKGSEREIYDPIESVIKNTFRIADIAERNVVAQSIADLKDISGMGITEVRPPMIPIGEIEHRAAIDIEYLGQVRKFAENLGAKIETGGQVGRALGYYYEGGKRIERKFATPEEVISHEVGHFLDHKYSLKERFYKSKKATREVGKEIYDFMKAQGQSTARLKKVSERFAHAFEWWLSNRALAKKDIPLFSSEIEKIIKEIPDLKPMLDIRPTPGLNVEAMREKVWRQSPWKPKGNVIEYFEGGKRKYIEVPKNLYDAMSGLNEASVGLATRIMAQPAHWLRVGATITPEFMFRNPIRDQLTAVIQTKVGFVPFIDTVGAVADIAKKSDAYYDWLRSGGANSTYVELSRAALKKRVQELKRNKPLLSKLNIIARAQDISQVFEQATRLAVYKSAVRRKGLTPVEGGFESRESTIDFFRRGAKTKDINAVIAFFNAGVQGFDRAIRQFRHHPVSSTAKAIMLITVPSIICHMINKDDPDYKELPRWQKDLFWCPFKIPGTSTFVRIPKPFLFGQIFGSVPERFLEYVETKDPEAFKDLYKSILDSVLPSQGDPSAALLPTALKPLIENATNWSFFRERPVVPESRKELLPYMQHGKYTPESIKEIGKLLNMSPSKIENLIRGYTGGTGAYAMEALDWLLEKEKRRPAELADYPLLKGFITRPAESHPESLNRFYEKSTKLIQVERSYKKLLKEKKAAEAKALREKHPEIVYAKLAQRTRKRLSEVTHMIDIVINSDLPDDQKREDIKKLETRRMELAQQALEKMQRRK